MCVDPYIKLKKMCLLNCLFRLLELLGLIRSDLDIIEPRMPEFVNDDADDFDPYLIVTVRADEETGEQVVSDIL